MKPQSPILSLQENASQFFEQFSKKHGSNMSCQSGCSNCCYTKISVFPSEAKIISDWFSQLDIESKERLIKDWQQTKKDGEDTSGEIHPACCFLYEEKCSIYPARPIICRSQGLPLLFNSPEDPNCQQMDVCPKNFCKKGSLPERESWLNLDRLNTLLSIANQNHLQNCTDTTDVDKNRRVPLDELQKSLIEKKST